ncbi:MAG: sensor histidine kinase KdpD [Proteobacteria bacterium]|nr:sensor histidine kinase KdpD [Pseudomonadota bacterium]
MKAARREARGGLKIILGAAPGVGKTYEMLSEGAALLGQGRDVIVGVVETHGRAETAALLAPFEVLPRRQIQHGAHKLDEFDIDAMLARKPRIALIDEFAHTNAPGSRHPKRWQDVEELRDAGIDVITTLNIQHIESLNDVVAGFTRVRVRETVPDACLEDAEIELVDLPPDELIERLKEGKVYVPSEAARALSHFFSKANLSALRELAMRRAAQTIDRQMLEHVRLSGESGNWAVGERLVVAVGDQPGGETLVRQGKRLADALGASWTVVSIETPRSTSLPHESQEALAAVLQLAATLGATLVTIPSTSVIAGLKGYIAENRATTLLIGKVRRSWWFELRHRSIVDQLVRDLDDVAIHVLPVSGTVVARERSVRGETRLRSYGAALGLVALTTLFNVWLAGLIGPYTISLIYLLPVVATSTFLGLRPSLLASFAAALAYNFLFLPPLYTFTIADPQNVVTFLVLIGMGVATSQLAGRLRREANVGARTANENAAIAAFGQKLAAVGDEAPTAEIVCREIAILLDCRTVLLLRKGGQNVVIGAFPAGAEIGPIDIAAIDWCFDRAEPTGRGTGTLAASDWQFHPLKTSLGTLAVIGIETSMRGDPVPADRRTLFVTLLGQAALAHERLRLEEEARQIAALRQRDALRATLLASIGHDLKTPLTSVVAAADALADERKPSPIATTLQAEARKLRRVFDDLVEMTRIEEGALKVRAEAVDLTDAVAAAVHDLRSELAGHAIDLAVPPSLPMVKADPRMLHRILVNLLSNAARHAPTGTPIQIEGAHRRDLLTLAVTDQGSGIPAGQERAIFDRFVKLEGSDQTGGTGLGLAIVRGFADAMGIDVVARNREDGAGAAFELAWPQSMIRNEVSPEDGQ